MDQEEIDPIVCCSYVFYYYIEEVAIAIAIYTCIQNKSAMGLNGCFVHVKDGSMKIVLKT